MSAEMMFVLFKGGLGFGLPLAFALWQLWDLRQLRLAREAEQARDIATPARTDIVRTDIVPLDVAPGDATAEPVRHAA